MRSRRIRRSKADIYSSILEVARRAPSGIGITRMSYGVGVPLDRLRLMVDDLTAFGLLRRNASGRETTYTPTSRGLEFLETYWKMNAYLETFEGAPSRALAAILFTDITGYTSLAQNNEKRALVLLDEYRNIVREALTAFHGREVKTIGDAFLLEFGSALEACECAIEIQRRMHERNLQSPDQGSKIVLRVGIHVGDIERKGTDILGDAVNIASRVYSLADPGCILITRQVFDQVWNKLGNRVEEAGKKVVKNVDAPIEVYSIVLPWKK